jgi:hypothetical protein
MSDWGATHSTLDAEAGLDVSESRVRRSFENLLHLWQMTMPGDIMYVLRQIFLDVG